MPTPMKSCDVNEYGKIDLSHIKNMLAARNTLAIGPDDARAVVAGGVTTPWTAPGMCAPMHKSATCMGRD
jgi:hypothetical protein